MKGVVLFVIVFLLLYGGMHFYAFRKAQAGLSLHPWAGRVLAAFVALMVFAPLLIWWFGHLGLETLSRIAAYIGYSWMGGLWLFFSASLCLDLYRLLVHSTGRIARRDLSAATPSPRLAFHIPLALTLGIMLYGYVDAWNIRTERAVIRTDKLPTEIERLRIVQISDVHVGRIVRERRVRQILDRVKKAQPDIFVSTGDLIDAPIPDIDRIAKLFREVRPKYGQFAVLGNHEYYEGIEHSIEFTERAGFRILRDSGTTVAGAVNIAGVDDPAGARFGLPSRISEPELLSTLPPGKFTILLKHRPDVDPDALGLFDLQLSGHTHRGQIFPFSLLTGLYYRNTINAGKLRLIDHSYLYVSRGSGTWGPPVRFLAPPEVSVIDIKHKSPAERPSPAIKVTRPE